MLKRRVDEGGYQRRSTERMCMRYHAKQLKLAVWKFSFCKFTIFGELTAL